MTSMTQRQLSRYIKSNMSKKANDILFGDTMIDVLWGEGIYFLYAIGNNDVSVMKNLLEYRNKRKDTLIDTMSDTRDIDALYNYKIRQILLQGVESHYVSQEMEDLINPYCGAESSTAEKSDVDLNEFEEDVSHTKIVNLEDVDILCTESPHYTDDVIIEWIDEQ